MWSAKSRCRQDEITPFRKRREIFKALTVSGTSALTSQLPDGCLQVESRALCGIFMDACGVSSWCGLIRFRVYIGALCRKCPEVPGLANVFFCGYVRLVASCLYHTRKIIDI